MIKVAFVMPNRGFSGAEKVVIQMINGLKDEFDCYYISQSGSIDKYTNENGSINTYLNENNIKHVPTRNRLNRQELKKILRQLNPDIVIATDYTASVIISTIKGKYKVISHLHNNPLWIKKINLNSIAFLLASFRLDKIFIVSDSIKNEYVFKKFLEKKYCLVSNPLSRKDVLNMSTNNCEKQYDISFIGRLCEEKDPEKFIRIVKKLKDKGFNVRALIMGDGSLKTKVINWIELYNVNDCIELRDFEKNPFPYFSKSKIIVMPSKFEGFGLVAFESLCLGVPVVASPVGGLVNVIDNKCGYFCQEEDEYVEIISKMLLDDNFYNEKVKYAIEKSIELDNYNEYINMIKKIIKTVVKGE